jgi:multidrug efflux pump subunit AcrA (membrane-fusion protein)
MRLGFIGIAGLLLAACARTATSPGAAVTAVPVTVAQLRYTQIATPIELAGSLAAVQSVTVGAISAGRVVSVNVRIGDVVRAGDVIAQIDASGSAAALAQAQASAAAAAAAEDASTSTIDAATASVASAAAQLEAARSRESLAATTSARMATLYAQGAISQQQRDQTLADAAEAQASVAQAQAGVAGARHNFAAAQSQSRAAAESAIGAQAGVAAANVPLRDATLTAPFGGTIVNKFVEPGAVVAPGSPVVTVQNSRDLEVDVAVPDDTAASLVPGAAIDVGIDAAGSTSIPAHIRAIIASQNPALRSSTLKIAVPDRPGLQPGMFVRVSIVAHTHSGWVAPLAALVTRAGQSGVFAVRNGIATFVPLQTGTVGATSVELLGIDGRGMQVAVSGLERLDDGSRVAVTR